MMVNMGRVRFFCANPARRRRRDEEKTIQTTETAGRDQGCRRSTSADSTEYVLSFVPVRFQYGVVGGSENYRLRSGWKHSHQWRESL